MVKRYIDTGVAIFRFLKAARNRAKEGMSKEQILDFARREFGEVSKLLRKQIDDIFKAKPKTEKKGDVVPIKKDEGIMSQYKSIDDEVTQAEKDAIFDNFLANADRTYANFVTKALRDIQNASKSEQQQMIKAIKDRTGMFRYLDDADAEKILKSVGVTKEGIVAADAAKEIVKKRTKDMAKGDVTGETSDLMKGLDDKMTGIKKAADELKEISDPGNIMEQILKGQRARDPRQGVVRAAAREILNKNKVNIGREDPINVLRQMYGEKGLEAVDAVSDSLLDAQNYGEMNTILTQNKLFDLVPKKTYGYDQNVVSAEKIRKSKEEHERLSKILDDYDVRDRDPNAEGGLINILKL